MSQKEKECRELSCNNWISQSESLLVSRARPKGKYQANEVLGVYRKARAIYLSNRICLWKLMHLFVISLALSAISFPQYSFAGARGSAIYKRNIHKKHVHSLQLESTSVLPSLTIPPDKSVGSIETLNPSVSALNGKFDLSGGLLTGEGNGYITGTVSMPTPGQLGIQFDGFAASVSGSEYIGVGGHLFTRDPQIGLLGIYGDLTHRAEPYSLDLARAGVEYSLYSGNFSLDGLTGMAAASGSSELQFFDYLDLSMYLNEDTRLTLGQHFEAGSNDFSAGLEHLIHPNVGFSPSVFADLDFGEAGKTARVGMRAYFGDANMNLMSIHRQNDPPTRLPQLLGYLSKRNVQNCDAATYCAIPSNAQTPSCLCLANSRLPGCDNPPPFPHPLVCVQPHNPNDPGVVGSCDDPIYAQTPKCLCIANPRLPGC